MPQQQNPQKQECKCVGDKKIKALEKQFADLAFEVLQLRKQIAILRKAIKK